MTDTSRAFVGFSILPLFLVGTLVIGVLAKRRAGGSANSFLNASRSLPLPMVVAAYIAANCAAPEIIGLSAMAAQYGVQAFHFYWIGAIPAMIFLALTMMPMYRRTQVRSVPEYLELRYGREMRLLNASVVAFVLLLLAGISLYAMGEALQVATPLSFTTSIALCAAVVLTYVLMGGIRATIYNEVLQLAMILVAMLPLAWHSARLLHTASAPQQSAGLHLWQGMPLFSQSAPMDAAGVVFGLGLVLSFGYWCTDFVMMQRAFAARTDLEARLVPLWAGFGKLFFSLLVVLPGLVVYRGLPAGWHLRRYDQALPALMQASYGPVMLGLGLTALAAGLMSSLAANISAFAAIWTQDIFRTHIRPHLQEQEYVRIGRTAAVLATVLSILMSYSTFLFSNLMEHVQLIFSIFGTPFWAVFLLGITTSRVTGRGAIVGFAAGIGTAVFHLILFAGGVLHYGSVMNANFHAATYAFAITCLTAVAFSRTPRVVAAHHELELYRSAESGPDRWKLVLLSVLLGTACIFLNVWWR